MLGKASELIHTECSEQCLACGTFKGSVFPSKDSALRIPISSMCSNCRCPPTRLPSLWFSSFAADVIQLLSLLHP